MRFNGYGHPDNFDITNRPSNASLTSGVIVRFALSAIPLAVLFPLPYVFWFSSEPSSTVSGTLSIIGAVIGMALYFPHNLRAGRNKRREFIAAGGDPTGISLLQFGAMGGHRLDDGRWQWSVETSSTY